MNPVAQELADRAASLLEVFRAEQREDDLRRGAPCQGLTRSRIYTSLNFMCHINIVVHGINRLMMRP